MILVGALVISIMAGCSSNGQVSNNPGQTANQPAKTAPSTIPNEEAKDPKSIDANKAVKELGIFKDQKNWEKAEVTGSNWGDAEICFNVEAGEKISFPFDVVVEYRNASAKASIVDSSTNIKKEAYPDCLDISALRPQSDGTLKLEKIFEIYLLAPYNSNLDGVEKNKKIVVLAGEVVTVVPKSDFYLAKNGLIEITNKANVEVLFFGTSAMAITADNNTLIKVTKGLLPTESYNYYLTEWLKYDKNMAAGEGEKD